MSKELKGTYLWNENIPSPSQEFDITFTNEVRTNYGFTSILGLTIQPVFDHLGNPSCSIDYDFIPDTPFNHVYSTPYSSGGGGWEVANTAYRNITFGNGDSGEIVSDEFYEWFTANASLMRDTVELSGTWRWNDTVYGFRDTDITFDTDEIVFHEDVNAKIITYGGVVKSIRVVGIGDTHYPSSFKIVYTGTDIGEPGIDEVQVYRRIGSIGEWSRKGFRTITVPSGTMVSKYFYCFFVSNAQIVELCELKGRWKWNDVPAYHTRDFDKVKIDFKSGFTDMEYIFVECNSNLAIADLSYLSSKFKHKVYGIVEQPYRIIDFGTTAQKVTKDFYEWFVVNATEQTLVEISGIWRFATDISPNALILLKPGIFEPVSFNTVTNAKTYLGVNVHYDDHDNNVDGNPFLRLSYCTYAEPSEVVEYNHVYYEETATGFDGSWTNALTNTTIDFGSTPQLVSSEFYDWFYRNAAKTNRTMSGTWVFKKELTAYPGKGFVVSGGQNFICNDERAYALCVENKDGNVKIHYYFADRPSAECTVFENGAWVDDGYRIITFNDFITIDDVTYRWFVENLEEKEFLLIERSTLIEIANIIRTKTGGSDKITVSNFRYELAKLPKASNFIKSVSIREIE